MKATAETIRRAVELNDRVAELRGYPSGLTEKHFAIFTEEELVELNKEEEKFIIRLEKRRTMK